MEIQTIIVAAIVGSALFYLGLLFWRKAWSFSAKNSCPADCGCAGKQIDNSIKT